MPRGPLGRRLAERLVVGSEVVVEQRAVVEVGAPELPRLRGLVEACLEPLALLVLRDVEEHLDDGRALVRQQALELADVPVATPPHRFRNELLDPGDADVLVMGTVEDPDLAASGAGGVHAPEVVVLELRLARRLERNHPAGLRVDSREDTPDRAVLP